MSFNASDHNPRRGVWLAVLVLAAAVAARAAINFANTTPGGMDAGYYPMQARSLIETESLMYRDVPLYHYAAALIARGLIVVGWSIDGAVLLASKLLDTLVPVGLGVAVLGLARLFAREFMPRNGAARPNSGVAAAAPVALAVLSGPAMRMVSDFQKQAAAMALLGVAVLACRRALRTKSVLDWAGVCVALGLTGLTHAGTFAAAALTIGLIVATHVTLFARVSPMRLAMLAGFGLVVAAGAFGMVYFADQGKAMGLVRGMSKLTRVSTGDAGGHGPGPGMDPVGLVLSLAAHAVGVWTLLVARRAADASAASRAVASGCALAAMALASPLLAPEYFMRLALMAPAPLSIALAFVLARRVRDERPARPAVVLLAASAASAVLPLSFLLRPMVSEQGIAEFRAMSATVQETPGTVVVARHGLEFWASYFLHCPVRTAPGKAADLAAFPRVLMLVEVDGGPGPGPRRGPAGGPERPRPRGPDGQRGPVQMDGPGPMGGPGHIPASLLGARVFEGTVFTLAERADP
jgi:hypothetical protein